TIDRTGLDPGVEEFFLFVDSSSGAAVLTVTFGIGGASLFDVAPDSVTIPVNIFGTEQDTDGEITISNPGEEPFSWTISFEDPDVPGVPVDLPGFISVNPQNGEVGPRALPSDPPPADIVTIEVDPAGVPDAGITDVNIVVNAEGIGSQAVTLRVIAILGPRLSIQQEPFLTLSGLLDYGTDEEVLTLGIGNTGGVGTLLEFTFSTDRPDLIKLPVPAAGESVGFGCLSIDFLFCFDWQPFSIVIDRAAMNPSAEVDGGLITIEAPGQTPIEVAVAVTRAPLRIEGANNRARPPYINRFVFLLRDSLLQAIDTTNPDVLRNISFELEENGIPLDLDETNFFVNGPEGLKQNLVLLLDFTGSMFRAGEVDGVPNGQFIDEMKTSAAEFIDDLPDTYRIAIMEYHEKDQTKREIHPFSTNKASLKAALNAFSLAPSDHGETEIFDALIDALDVIANQDPTQVSFDESDVRSIVFVSDGNDTSSAVPPSEVLNDANARRVRLYPIVFGDFVNLAPLVVLGKESGGHSFSVIAPRTLSDFLGTSEEEGQVWRDLQRQLVLTYVSLLGANGAYNVTATVRDQTGATISGSFQRAALVFPGDPRAGQLSLTTTGIDTNGRAEVILRTDYVPRNVTQFRVRFIVPGPFRDNVEEVALLTSSADGGLTAGWRLVPEGDNVFTLVTAQETPLQFAAFGGLLRMTFSGLGAAARFEVGFRADNELYIDPDPNTTVDTNYFLYPGGFTNSSAVLTVEHESSLAAPGGTVESLQIMDFDPRAEFAFDRDEDGIGDFDDPAPDDGNVPTAVVTPELISFPATSTQKSFTIRNNRLDTFDWELVAEGLPFGIEFSATFGRLEPGDTEIVVATIDRGGLPPGTFNGDVDVFTNLSNESDTLAVTVEVQ
ncbi:MAG: vWA domain-containing protein, partial [Candidatus Hydrogenedentota bacterium]